MGSCVKWPLDMLIHPLAESPWPLTINYMVTALGPSSMQACRRLEKLFPLYPEGVLTHSFYVAVIEPTNFLPFCSLENDEVLVSEWKEEW